MMFYYAAGGALMCDEEIPEVTHDVGTDRHWYGGWRHFVAESMSKETARRIAHLLGGTLIESNIDPNRQLTGKSLDTRREQSRHAMYGVHYR